MKFHQNYIALMVAAGLALIVLLANIFVQSADSMQRMGFAAALYLICRDTLAGAAIAKGPRKLTNPARWVLAFYLALYFGTFMALALWPGIEVFSSQLVGVALGATLFGVLVAFTGKTKPHPYAHHFETEKPMLPSRLGALLYYIAPPIKIAAIWGMVQFGPPTTAYLFFYIILIGFAFPRYRRKSNGNFLWANFPAIVGYILLVLLIGLNL